MKAVQARIQQHLEETGRQKERLEKALDILGETTSSYSFEHYEIAAYESLQGFAMISHLPPFSVSPQPPEQLADDTCLPPS